MVLELKPGHTSGQKELEQSAHAGALLDQAVAQFDAEDFDSAAEALGKLLDISSECSQVNSNAFVHLKATPILHVTA